MYFLSGDAVYIYLIGLEVGYVYVFGRVAVENGVHGLPVESIFCLGVNL